MNNPETLDAKVARLMALHNDAAEARHTQGAPEYNSISAAMRKQVEAALRTELSSVVQGEPVAVAVVAHGRLGNRLMWGTEDAQANTPVGAQLYTTPQPAIDTDRLREIIACAYQIAGAYDAPAHVLDVLANPLEATQAQIDALLPFVPDQPIGGEVTDAETTKLKGHDLRSVVETKKAMKQFLDNRIAAIASQKGAV